jgi:20S proteasome alpha/beta subunit
MLLTLLLSLIFVPSESAQTGGMRYGGTFIGAVICSDGIVVASDSRTTLLDKNGTGFAYIDGMPKIFTGPAGAVAVSGLTDLEGELFSSFVQRNEHLLARPVHEVLFGFVVWLPFANGENLGLISAGYVEGKPMICVKSPIHPQSCSNAGHIGSKQSATLDALKNLRRVPTTAEAATALRTAIEESAKVDITVGGPISILKISNNGAAVWIQNPPNDRGWTNVCDMIQAHRSGKARIVPRESAAEVNKRLAGACRK